MNKVYCRYCGRQIDEDASFCTYCGKEQNVSKKQSLNFDGQRTSGKRIVQKALALVRIPVDYVRTIKIPRMSTERANLWRKRMKRVGKVLLVIVFIAIIVAAGAWGYSYYYDDYLPEKRLNDACEDIVKKFHSNDKALSLEYSRKILLNNWAFVDNQETWGYNDVSDNRITERVSQYRNEAFGKIESEAYNGNPQMQYLLGRIYIGIYANRYRGVGGSYIYERKYAIEPDTVKAVYWWNEAAKQGYTLAYNSMGIAYKLGWGVDKDMKKAIEYLKKGAESGDAKAQCNYGDLFKDGVKIHTGSHVVKEPQYIYGHYYGTENVTIQDSVTILPKDIDQAKYWWEKSANNGNVIAKERLQKIYE
jgi:hypothetical protein